MSDPKLAVLIGDFLDAFRTGTEEVADHLTRIQTAARLDAATHADNVKQHDQQTQLLKLFLPHMVRLAIVDIRGKHCDLGFVAVLRQLEDLGAPVPLGEDSWRALADKMTEGHIPF